MHRAFRLSCLAAIACLLLACAGSDGTEPEPSDPFADDDGASGEPGDGAGDGSAKPASLPDFADLSLYADDAPVNRPIPAGAALDPSSADYVALMTQAARDGGFLIELRQYSTPVYFATADTPRRSVSLACGQDYAGVDSLRGVPIPDFAEPAQDVDGADNPIPAGRCGEDSDQDNAMTVVDLATRCEYDFWQARLEDGTWVASWANSISLDGRGIYEKGLSTRGSGFTELAGQIWPDELERGVIEHALIFSYPFPKAGGPVPPATESDGVSDARFALPEGARVRLDPALDLDALDLEPYERTIARALQAYGMFLVDINGSGVSIEAIDPRSVRGDPYEGLLPDEDYPSLGNIPVDRFQVLELPAQVPDFDARNELVDSGCATFL